jgi:glycerophosphoryl diester phosphodiesterase
MPTISWKTVLERPRGASPLLMAHRGSSNELPENTLVAFQRALDQGADVLECDIRFTRDNEIILMHDGALDRTTNGTGTVSQMTLSEIKKFRVVRSFEHKEVLGDGEIPTLAEFLQFSATSGVPVALELKDDRFIERADGERLIEILSHANALDRAALLSFSGARIRACKQLAPQLPIGIITVKNPFPLYETELMGPIYPLLYLNPFYFWWARRRKKIACPLDPEPEPRLGFYRRIGVPVLLTNHPAVTKRALATRGWV